MSDADAESQGAERPRRSDTDLIRGAQAGDDRAREEIFRRFVGPLYATAHRLTGNSADAEDLTQETFVRALRALADFRQRSSFHTWLYRILLNVTHDHFRKSAKERARLTVELMEDTTVTMDEADAGPPEAASAREERELLRSALRELPENQRVAVTLVYLDGVSCREAAEMMNAREGTVYWWLHQARKRLARRLSSIL